MRHTAKLPPFSPSPSTGVRPNILPEVGSGPSIGSSRSGGTWSFVRCAHWKALARECMPVVGAMYDNTVVNARNSAS